jgi:dolichol-phosphate mannosyltransferase
VRSVLVVPTYQEAENIDAFLRAVHEAVPELEVIVADDNSPDGTGKLAEVAADELGGIEVLHRPQKEGLGAAYRHGFRHALDRGFDVIIQMDADFSHDPAVLPELLAAIESGADVAIGSRYVPGGNVPNWTWFRRALSRYGNEFARWALRLAVRDATSGFRAYTASIMEDIDIDGTTANGYLFQIETGYRLTVADARMVERPITFADRRYGASKMAVVRTMVETQARVTWWGLCMRAPAATGLFRRTPPGRYLASKVRPKGVPIAI